MNAQMLPLEFSAHVLALKVSQIGEEEVIIVKTPELSLTMKN